TKPDDISRSRKRIILGHVDELEKVRCLGLNDTERFLEDVCIGRSLSNEQESLRCGQRLIKTRFIHPSARRQITKSPCDFAIKIAWVLSKQPKHDVRVKRAEEPL